MFFKRQSLSEKMLLIILSISGICVILTTVAITALGINNMQNKMISDLDLLTRTRAAILYAPVNYSSSDERYVSDIQNALPGSRSDAEVMACVYRSDGLTPDKFLAKYPTEANCPSLEEVTAYENQTVFKDKGLHSYRLIGSKDNQVGYIYVQSDEREIDHFIKTQVLTAILIIITVFVLSYFLGKKLQRSISQPILKLVDTTRRVSYERDYSIRAENFLQGDDIKRNEISVLIEAFNQMLNEVEERRKLLLRKNQELVKSKEIAESANRAKSQFLANISHELRTPLNAVIGFSDLIRNEILGPIEDIRYVEYARDINESGEHLLHIINDILDLSKAEAGKLEPVLREVVLKKSLDECVTYIAKRAADNDIKVTVDVPEKMPTLIADRVMFKRIISNLLSNSVKFTNRGGSIKVSANVKVSSKRENIFTIVIEDTGIGMSKEDIDLAFKSFVQLDSGLNRKYEGTGLGLPLTKKLVELHGGNIELQSTVGEGTKAILKFYSPNNEA